MLKLNLSFQNNLADITSPHSLKGEPKLLYSFKALLGKRFLSVKQSRTPWTRMVKAEKTSLANTLMKLSIEGKLKP